MMEVRKRKFEYKGEKGVCERWKKKNECGKEEERY